MKVWVRFLGLIFFLVLFQSTGFSQQLLNGSEVLSTCKKYVQEKTGLTDEELAFDFAYPFAAVTVPQGKISFQVSGIVDQRLSARLPLEVKVFVEQDLAQVLYPIFNVDYKIYAYMVKQWLKKGEYLTPNNVMKVQVNKANLPTNAIKNDYELEGKVAKTALAGGKIITANNIEEPALVIHNQPVVIQVNVGGVKVQTKGIAVRSGKRGEVIEVRNLDSKKIVYARIIAKDTVIVEVP